MTDIGPHLERLGLEQYLDAFIGEGFDMWETILDIQEGDLDALNVKLGHRRKLQRAIAEYRGYSSERPLGSPPQDGTSEPSRPFEGQQNSGQAKESGPAPAQEAKRKYRRHPKPDENAPEKPPSAYVLFSNRIREEVKGENLSFTEIARLVGDRWQKLDPNQKEPFESQASALKETYNAQLSNYKRTDAFKEYSQYLVEFKAKHGQQPETHKRPKLDAHSSGGSLSAASTGEVGEGPPPPPPTGHTRGGSLGSISMTSYGGTLPSPADGPSAPASSLPHLTAPVGRLTGSVNRGGSPPPTHFVQERKLLGHMSSHSSVSEESSVVRGEQHDPLSRAATLSLSTPPTGTPPPLPSSSAIPSRQEYSGSADPFTWSHRYPPATQHIPTMSSSTASPHGPAITLPSPTAAGEGWRDKGSDGGRRMHHPTAYQSPSQLNSLPFTHFLASEQLPDLSHSQVQRTLPPLRPPPAAGGLSLSGFPSFTGNALPPQHGNLDTSQPQLGPIFPNFNRSESEAADTLAELAGRRPPDNPSKRSSESRRRR